MRFRSLLVLMFGFAISASAADPQLEQSEPLLAKKASQIYIVQMREDPIAAYRGGVNGIAATKPGSGGKIDLGADNVRQYFDHLAASHDSLLSAVGATEKVYSYCYSFNGFAAKLSPAQITALEGHADVVGIWRDELLQPHTDNSPSYLGLTGPQGPWRKGLTGEDVVIGVIDTGVWPEHPSFADVSTPRFGDGGPLIPYDDQPASWSGSDCAFGNAAYNPLDESFECNDKLLGASYFADAFMANSALIPSEYLSARDNDGHGSHTASTAGGNAQVAAEIGGVPLGTVSGMAPRARVAVYKVCWNGSFPPAGFENGCFESDSMAAIDQAVADGVDVINYSIGGASTSFSGADDIAFLFAADAGVFVATSQGNSGPGPGTTGTPAGVPWLTSVGATQDNQVFNIGLDISSTDTSVVGIKEAVEADISVPLAVTGPVTSDLVVADDGSGTTGNQACGALVNGADLAGNIALISRGSCAFSTKILSAQDAGAAGVVVFNNAGDPIVMGGDPTGIVLPAVMIGQNDGEALQATLVGGDGITATMSSDILIPKVNTVAGFSSRGPNGGAPDIIKPDIAAPGVDTLAAHTPTPNDGNVPGELFQSLNGTSMASPHVAGIGALLRQARPDWTPEMIRSALMTTARQKLNKTFGGQPADPFDMGAGLVNAQRSLNPGLVYQAGLLDYVQFLCGEPRQANIFSVAFCDAFGSIDPSDLNLPSIGIADLVGTQTITRTVTNVKNGRGTQFKADVRAPAGVDVSVTPAEISLMPGESRTFEVSFTTNAEAETDQWTFGELTWVERTQRDPIRVESQMAVRPVAASFPEEVSEVRRRGGR